VQRRRPREGKGGGNGGGDGEDAWQRQAETGQGRAGQGRAGQARGAVRGSEQQSRVKASLLEARVDEDPRAWKRERRFRSLAGWWPLLLPTAPPELPNLLAVLTGMAF
jgi:hypothetical protein